LRDTSFNLRLGLFRPQGPFSAHHAERPGLWRVRDADGTLVATARTRAGARVAIRALHALAAEGWMDGGPMDLAA